MRPRTMGSIGAVLTLAVASVALAAADHDLNQYGGSGGTYWDTDTVTHGFMVGFHLHTGQYTDNLLWIDSNGDRGNPHGGSGGSWQGDTTCPSGWVVLGIYGGATQYVDRIGIICINRDTQATESEPTHGGSGGGSYDSRCTWDSITHESAVGVQGSAGAYIDRIGLICNVDPRP